MIEYDEITPQAIRFLFEELSQLLIDYRKNHYKLGRVLHRIRHQRLYERCRRPAGQRRGYETWEEFCNAFMGFSRSKGDMLASNYEKLSAMELDESGDTFSRCMRLGWNKLNEVLRVAGNEDNLIRWLNEADGMSTEMLRLKISQAQREAYEAQARERGNLLPEEDGLPDGVEPPVRGGGRRRTAAPAPPPDVDGDPDAPLSPDNPTGYVSYQIRFPDNETQETFVTAMRLMKKRYDADMGAGTCIGMMALHYLATVPSEAQGGAPIEVADMVRLLEANYGMRFECMGVGEPSAMRENRRRKAAKKKASKKKKKAAKKKTTKKKASKKKTKKKRRR